MEKSLKILLVEDDSEICKSIIDYSSDLDDVKLIGVTNNSDKAIEYLCDYTPDAVILDLELNDGVGSGIKFLQEYKYSYSLKPYILVTTNNSSEITHNIVRQLGADYIMSKHQTNYNSSTPVEFLRSLKNILISRRSEKIEVSDEESEEKAKQRIKRRIIYELDLIGVSQKSVGYNYLIDAIEIIIKEPQPNICDIIAKRYKKTEASVERAMQNAIQRTWKSADIEDLLANYKAKINSEKGVPTLTEFIYYYANKVKNGL